MALTRGEILNNGRRRRGRKLSRKRRFSESPRRESDQEAHESPSNRFVDSALVAVGIPLGLVVGVIRIVACVIYAECVLVFLLLCYVFGHMAWDMYVSDDAVDIGEKMNLICLGMAAIVSFLVLLVGREFLKTMGIRG